MLTRNSSNHGISKKRSSSSLLSQSLMRQQQQHEEESDEDEQQQQQNENTFESSNSQHNNRPTIDVSKIIHFSTSSNNNNHNNNNTTNNNMTTTNNSTTNTSTTTTTTTTTTSSGSSSSSSSSNSKPFQIPEAFGIIESEVYRCSLPTKSDHFSFLETLELKSIVFLSQEVLEKSFVQFCEKNRVKLINLGTTLVQYPSVSSSNSWNFMGNSGAFVDRANNHRHAPIYSSATTAAMTTNAMATTLMTNGGTTTKSSTSMVGSKNGTNNVKRNGGGHGLVDDSSSVSSHVSCTSWKHCSEQLIKETLELLLDKRNHPMMIMCSSGVHLTGTVVGCLRRLQSWSLTSILDEYESFAHHKSRYVDRQFIELFDTDLVCVPIDPYIPHWFIVQKDMMRCELQYLSRNKVIVKSSQVPTFSKDDKRMAFQEYWFCRDAPLISAKSTFTKQSVIEEEDE